MKLKPGDGSSQILKKGTTSAIDPHTYGNLMVK